MTDHSFPHRVADTLAALPAVQAVSLGGSRAQGGARPDSDWDFGIYYRGDFDPQALRELGWAGEVSDIGGWGGGVFNGGAWLSIDGRKVDVHYRDLDVVETQVERAERGEFDIEPLMFHLAGIPTYLLVAELVLGRTLRGELPTVETYPGPLRRSAAVRWAELGEMTLSYAEHGHARQGRVTQALGLAAVAASQYAHAILASRGEWVTNEKRLLEAAGLTAIDTITAHAIDDAPSLVDLISRTRDTLASIRTGAP